MPEGHRYQQDELGEMHGGVARWARKTEAPTIPGAVRGVDSLPHAIRRRSAEVIFGAAIDPPASREDEKIYMNELRKTITKSI